MKPEQSLIFELSRPGRSAYSCLCVMCRRTKALMHSFPEGCCAVSRLCYLKYPRWM